MNRMASGLPRRMLPANLEADFLYKKISNYNKSEEEKQNIIGMINLINAINFDSSNPAEKLKSKNDIINFTKQHALDPPYIYVQNSYPFGVTPLWLAVKNNYTEFIEPLLNAGAHANITVGVKLYDIASPEAKAILDKYKGGGRYRRKSLKKRNKNKSKKSKTRKRA